MKPTQALQEAGQSLWLDNITRALLDEGILARYVAEYSVTGLTSNPIIFDRAIRDGTAYDADIAARKADGSSAVKTLLSSGAGWVNGAAAAITSARAVIQAKNVK
ncbi:MAG TPA: transaldolase family protein, partial [Streptosporangiaceae bacterium]|nr:transaldolase family protein [Streptosporangiaceae bacterium]